MQKIKICICKIVGSVVHENRTKYERYHYDNYDIINVINKNIVINRDQWTLSNMYRKKSFKFLDYDGWV